MDNVVREAVAAKLCWVLWFQMSRFLTKDQIHKDWKIGFSLPPIGGPHLDVHSHGLDTGPWHSDEGLDIAWLVTTFAELLNYPVDFTSNNFFFLPFLCQYVVTSLGFTKWINSNTEHWSTNIGLTNIGLSSSPVNPVRFALVLAYWWACLKPITIIEPFISQHTHNSWSSWKLA